MRPVQNAVDPTRNVGDPCAEYLSMEAVWERVRAACAGQRAVQDFDRNKGLDLLYFSNLLTPLSPTMDSIQYKFFLAEAEWPNVTGMYLRVLLGGLLRKRPKLTLPDSIPKKEEATEWLMQTFGADGSSMSAFLDSALFEELQTARAWVFVDYPSVDAELSADERAAIAPFAIIKKAEEIINWTVINNKLARVIVREFKEEYKDDDFHPTIYQVLYVHELHNGKYRVRQFEKRSSETNVATTAGRRLPKTGKEEWVETVVGDYVMVNGDTIDFIPAWPLNGEISIREPHLSGFVDKEVHLYNKKARKNHLMYIASTYTPVICADLMDGDFEKIVDAGLGSWIHLPKDSTASVLSTPTNALKDMEAAVEKAYDELARLGIRLLSPEVAQSGVALELRNASQSAQLGTLNNKISATMCSVIAFMLKWRYDVDVKASDIVFSMSEDFNPAPLGADWLRLITEWYERRLIPRSSWLQLMKMNDILPPEYDDEEGVAEINEDELIMDNTVDEQTKKKFE